MGGIARLYALRKSPTFEVPHIFTILRRGGPRRMTATP